MKTMTITIYHDTDDNLRMRTTRSELEESYLYTFQFTKGDIKNKENRQQFGIAMTHEEIKQIIDLRVWRDVISDKLKNYGFPETFCDLKTAGDMIMDGFRMFQNSEFIGG